MKKEIPKEFDELVEKELSDSAEMVAFDIHELRNFISKALQKQREELEKYNELIMAVESKYKNETRHNTALRYIKKAEQHNNKAVEDIKNKLTK